MSKAVFKTTSKPAAVKYKSRSFGGSDWIFREGEIGTDMFVIQKGQVEIIKEVENQPQRLALLERGDFFGEMALLEDLPRNAGARGVVEGQLLQIDGSTFTQMLQDNPEIAVRMMRKLARRLRKTDELLRRSSEKGVSIHIPPDESDSSTQFGPERLIHDESGMEFAVVLNGDTMVGRKDPVTGIYPEIDLTPVDNQRSISRRHAKLFRRGDKLYLCEEIGTMNGTFVNSERLATGVPSEVKAGDAVRFGVVETVLRVD